jgi:hypothetical protein
VRFAGLVDLAPAKWGGPISVGAACGSRPRVNRLRLPASAARTARPCGESLLELTFQTLARDVMFCLKLQRDLDPDPRGLEADDFHVVGHVLPVRMVIAVAFFKRIFTRSLPMNQAHGLVIGEVLPDWVPELLLRMDLEA